MLRSRLKLSALLPLIVPFACKTSGSFEAYQAPALEASTSPDRSVDASASVVRDSTASEAIPPAPRSPSHLDSAPCPIYPERFGLSKRDGVRYLEDGDPAHQFGTVWYPSTRGGPFPAIVYFPGGGWESYGTDFDGPGQGPDLAKKGFVVFRTYYQLAQSGKGAWPKLATDALCALRHVRANARSYDVDPTRIVVWGESAGGHLASLVASLRGNESFLDPSVLSRCGEQKANVAAAIDYWGATDLLLIASRAGEGGYPDGHIRAMVGGPASDALASKWRAASPTSYVRAGLPPFLIVHGTSDSVVSPRISEAYANALRAAHVPLKYVSIPEGTHGFRNEADAKHAACETERFLGSVLPKR